MHFQLRMLPDLPDLSPLRCELRYEPASELPRLGGDWCDAVLLPDGGISVVIGDVTGHVVAAAPIMAQIRNMLRALVFDHGGPPSLVVSKLARALTMFAEPPTATLVLTRLERARRRGVPPALEQHGTPPPLLLHPGLGARFRSPACHGIPVGVDPTVPGTTMRSGFPRAARRPAGAAVRRARHGARPAVRRRCHPARPARAGPPGAVRHPVVRFCGSGGLVRTSGPVTGP
ncbi:PP2C family protein-serine/threonine phosphatase [Streptomyces griseofuscus]|uniref:PP2C family protein-serine/threonine phosphatase n=1 Tax=Streptomyces griseofuscus TaxID=146922 RepID=UPI00382272CB